MRPRNHRLARHHPTPPSAPTRAADRARAAPLRSPRRRVWPRSKRHTRGVDVRRARAEDSPAHPSPSITPASLLDPGGGAVITQRDLALIPMNAARVATAPDLDETDAQEWFAKQLTKRALDRVRQVILRLVAQASAPTRRPAARCWARPTNWQRRCGRPATSCSGSPRPYDHAPHQPAAPASPGRRSTTTSSAEESQRKFGIAPGSALTYTPSATLSPRYWGTARGRRSFRTASGGMRWRGERRGGGPAAAVCAKQLHAICAELPPTPPGHRDRAVLPPYEPRQNARPADSWGGSVISASQSAT